MDFRFDIIYEYRWMFYNGVDNVGLTVVATAGGLVLGLLLALARLINPESRCTDACPGLVLRKISFGMLRCSRHAIVCTNCDLAYGLVPIFVQSRPTVC